MSVIIDVGHECVGIDGQDCWLVNYQIEAEYSTLYFSNGSMRGLRPYRPTMSLEAIVPKQFWNMPGRLSDLLSVWIGNSEYFGSITCVTGNRVAMQCRLSWKAYRRWCRQ